VLYNLFMPEWKHEELEKRFPGIKVFVSGCVERGDGSSFRAKAHAHNYKDGPYFGWICVRSPKRLLMKDGRLSRLMLHEIAHILTPDHGHDDVWRKKVREIGGALYTRHQKKLRPKIRVPLPALIHPKSLL
jgi:hypothetical protein